MIALSRNVILFVLLFYQTTVFASDRSHNIHSRIVSTLSGFLYPSDFVVIVKKLEDFAGDSSHESGQPVGAIMALPGLRLSVDSNGKLIRQDSSMDSYNGPVEVTVLIDSNVKQETITMIQKKLPEIMGSFNDEDSVRVEKATLRQPDTKSTTSPSIVIQNMPPQTSDGKTTHDELYKALAIALLGSGLLMWLMSRKDVIAKNDPGLPHRAIERSPNSPNLNPAEPKESLRELIASFPAQVVAFYILKTLKDGETDKFIYLGKNSGLHFQRVILGSLPLWVSSYILKEWNRLNMLNKDDTSSTDHEEYLRREQEMGEILVRELALLEKEMTSENDRKHRLFLEIFPLSVIEENRVSLRAINKSSLITIATIRPEISFLLTELDVDAHEEHPIEIDSNTLTSAFEELWNLKIQHPSLHKKFSAIQIWEGVIQKCMDLEEVEKQLKKASSKLSQKDFQELMTQVAGRHSLQLLNNTPVSDFLRRVDAIDLVWLLSTVEKPENWNFEKMMRPLRLTMFKDAFRQKKHQSWTENEVKAASQRVLAILKDVVLQRVETTHEKSA